MNFFLPIILMAFSTVGPPGSAPAGWPAEELTEAIEHHDTKTSTVPSPQQVVNQFVEHVQNSPDLPPEAGKAVVDAWQQHGKEQRYRDFLHTGLAIMSPKYKKALEATNNQKPAEAQKYLQALLDAEDPYISLHAAVLLGRCLVEQRHFGQAEKILQVLAARETDLRDKTLMEADVDFLLAYSRLALGKNKMAQSNFRHFLREHPQAPADMRKAADKMLERIDSSNGGDLSRASELMAEVSDQLVKDTPYAPITKKQKRIVALLDKLIEQAEKQQQQQSQSQSAKQSDAAQKKMSPGGQANTPSNMPMGDSYLPGGTGEPGQQRPAAKARPGEVWGRMPPKEREKILQSLQRNFPARYRQLIEQYYTELGKEQ